MSEIKNLQTTSTAPNSPLPHEIQIRKEERMKKYNWVFRNDIHAGLPPKRAVDHEIKTIEGTKPPHWALFQLSPAELLATTKCVTKILNQGKIQPSKSPYGGPVFFVKQKDKIRGVIDYRALNSITTGTTRLSHGPTRCLIG